MADPIDPKAKLFAIYNQDRINNGLPTIMPDDFDMGTPEAYSGSRSPKNTRLYLQPKPSSSAVGRITLYYDRINLATITNLTLVKASEANIVDLLPKINTELGVALVAADIVNTTLPASGPFNLTASATNLVYTGTTSVAFGAA
jgi:hypothetical protein